MQWKFILPPSAIAQAVHRMLLLLFFLIIFRDFDIRSCFCVRFASSRLGFFVRVIFFCSQALEQRTKHNYHSQPSNLHRFSVAAAAKNVVLVA